MAIDLRGRSSVSFYDTFSAFPSTGSTTTLYVDRGDMVVYIWNGSSYEQLNNGSNITTVANYSALLAIGASNVPNMFYWCSSAQGTSWLPGPLGGTYYNSGLYYSNGTTWEYMNSPYQATQAEVDAGIVADKFVTPSTFYNSSKWASTPITIGTTPITSGVAGRVLFEGAGNVVQEDAGFSFSQTTKALTLTSTYVATGVPTLNIIGSGLNVCPYYRVVSDGGVSEATLVATRTGGASAGGINRAFLSLSNAAGGHNVISSNDGLAFSAAGHTAYSSVNDQMRLKNGNLGIGTGYSATARLDIKAQGALSTDIALRVVESTNIRTPFAVLGNEITQISADGVGFAGSALPLNIKSATSGYDSWLGLDIEHTVRTGYMAIQSQGIQSDYNNVRFISGSSKGNGRISAYITQSNTDKVGHWQFRTQVHLGDAFRLRNPNYGTHSLVIETGISPTTTPLDGFAQYSADITAGNAAPHFRTENGSVVKLYKQDLPTNPTNAELATFLSNLGLANLI